MPRSRTLWAVAAALALLPTASRAGDYVVTPLVEDQLGVAQGLGFVGNPLIDPNLVNAWGVSFSGGSPMWVSDNNPSLSTGLSNTSLYAFNTGVAVPRGQFVLPDTPSNPANPTGQVFNGTGAFGGHVFILASESGGIFGFKGGNPLNVLQAQDANSAVSGPVYKGLALTSINGVPTLLATNFSQNSLDAFSNSNFNTTTNKLGAATHFGTDPTLPSNFSPFNVAQLGGKIYVTFALQNGTPNNHDDQAGPGNGFVDIFDPKTGTFTRFISNGVLNSPWGLALAPPGFSHFGGDLLVGNFGDGTINAFDPNTGAFLGTLTGPNGPIMIDGLWDITFGNGGAAGPTNRLFFTAGPNGETDGLLGAIDPVPEPGTLGLFVVGAAGLWMARRRRAQPA
jgi:uncharacterized protein (TIGR03118 family)